MKSARVLGLGGVEALGRYLRMGFRMGINSSVDSFDSDWQIATPTAHPPTAPWTPSSRRPTTSFARSRTRCGARQGRGALSPRAPCTPHPHLPPPARDRWGVPHTGSPPPPPPRTHTHTNPQVAARQRAPCAPPSKRPTARPPPRRTGCGGGGGGRRVPPVPPRPRAPHPPPALPAFGRCQSEQEAELHRGGGGAVWRNAEFVQRGGAGGRHLPQGGVEPLKRQAGAGPCVDHGRGAEGQLPKRGGEAGGAKR